MKYLKSKRPSQKKRSPKKRNRRDLDELFEKGRNFFENLKPDDKIALIYHMDMDGVCSAAIICHSLKRSEMPVEISKCVPATYDEIEDVFKTLEGFNKVIIVDIGVDQELGSEKSILLVDHHAVKRDVTTETTVFINPRMANPDIYQPVSYVIYKLLSTFVKIEDIEWIAALGTVSDLGYQDCKDVMDNWVEGIEDKSDLYNTRIGKIADVLSGATYILGINKILEMLIQDTSLEELEKSAVVKEAYGKYEALFNKNKKQFWDKAETIGNVIFSRIKPSLKRLGSPIINRLSFENRDKIIFLLEERNDRYKISVRFQDIWKHDGLHLGEMMKRCCGGGGHRSAAGGSIKIEDYEKFKELVLKELKKFDV